MSFSTRLTMLRALEPPNMGQVFFPAGADSIEVLIVGVGLFATGPEQPAPQTNPKNAAQPAMHTRPDTGVERIPNDPHGHGKKLVQAGSKLIADG
jgi:hypothetical protein